LISPSAVSFDLVGTLIGVRGSVGAQYADLAARYDICANPLSIEREFPVALCSAAFHKAIGAPRADTARLEKEVWRTIVRTIFARTGALESVSPSTFESYFDALFAHFMTAAAWQVYTDALPVLEQLRARGSALALVTNFDARVFPLLENLGLARFFRTVAIPGVAGSAKPQPGIFRYALTELGLREEQVVHVGDSLEDDIRAAQAVGLVGIWLDRKGSTTFQPGIPRIASLAELPALFDRPDRVL
jgi:putative hydrolase of the HAD superfamily